MPYKNTTELVEGNVVLSHRMRILIDGPAKIYEHSEDSGDVVYVWPGLVLNADALCDTEGPEYDAYIACHLRGQWWRDRVPLPRRDDWPIQGNHLARWFVEEPS